MTQNICIRTGYAVDAADNRMTADPDHIIVQFEGRNYATRLADWLDNTNGLLGTVQLIEYEGDTVRIDLAMMLDEDEPAIYRMRLVKQSIESFCYSTKWDAAPFIAQKQS